MHPFAYTLITGIGATAVMDLWNLARKHLFGIALPDYGLVGRWVAHMAHGRFRHAAIARSPAIRGEPLIGWGIHYLTGIAFAAIPLALPGSTWMRHPTLMTALAVGITTVAAPFLLMQPGMGAGIAACRTPKPSSARLHSVINHLVFGLGLYFSAWSLQLTQSA
jgi:hypothetical protein